MILTVVKRKACAGALISIPLKALTRSQHSFAARRRSPDANFFSRPGPRRAPAAKAQHRAQTALTINKELIREIQRSVKNSELDKWSGDDFLENTLKQFRTTIESNAPALESAWQAQDFGLKCKRILDQFLQRLQQQKVTKGRYLYDSYSEFKSYCDDPPFSLSTAELENGRRMADSMAEYFGDLSKGLLISFQKFVSSGVEQAWLTVDMTNPALWYPEARAIHRKIILHIGPTNSGKTYNALQAFQKSDTGFYAGPLRLLAKEVFNRMKSAGKPCSLVTGEEVVESFDESGELAGLAAGTVEMTDLNRDLDIAVIDEIQMIEDRDRGWAWTQAVLGVRAKQVHLCGDASSEKAVRRLAELTGDKLEVVRYERLSPLKVDTQPLKGLESLQPGDCLVAFSKRELYAWKNAVEKEKKSKCAVIYGSLPADTRSKQAMHFNDPDSEYKYLVASDAISMGLNLAIKRVIFTTVRKFDGLEEIEIPIAQTKQIAGRAGRYKIAPNHSKGVTDPTEESLQEESCIGRVTTLEKSDLAHVKRCLAAETPPISRVGLFPSDLLLTQFAMKFGMHRPFHEILEALQVNATTSSWFFLTDLRNLIETSKIFADVKGLLFDDISTLAKAPVFTRSHLVRSAFKNFCFCIANGYSRNILEIPQTGVHQLERDIVVSPTTSNTLEDVHRVINLFIWLSYRFPTIFLDRQGAFDLKALCEEKISKTITISRGTRRTKSKLLGLLSEPTETSTAAVRAPQLDAAKLV